MMQWLTGGRLSEDGVLVWSGDPAATAAAVVVCAGVLVWAVQRRGTRRVEELALWLGAMLTLLWAIADPNWAEETGREEPGISVMLVDASRSMRVSDGGRSRSEQAAAIVERFGDDATVLPLDKWGTFVLVVHSSKVLQIYQLLFAVFNTEAHPLPIRGGWGAPE